MSLLSGCSGLCTRIYPGKAETDRIYFRSVEALALAVDAKDSVSSGHLKRVQIYSTEIAKAFELL